MSQLVARVDECEDLATDDGSRFRIVGQLVELESYQGNMYVSLRSLPEFQGSTVRTLKAVMSPAVYDSRFVRPHQKPQAGDAVSAWLVMYLEGGKQLWELLDITPVSLRELESLRIFLMSSVGQQFLALSGSSRRE